MSPETLTAVALVGGALAAIIGAVGGIVAAILAYRSKRAAEDGKAAAEVGQAIGEANAAKLMVVEGVVMTLGPALDGRLSQLLKAEIGKAFAAGQLQGEQTQRDRTAEPIHEIPGTPTEPMP